jgi:citrate lyase subunit beta / citryl-CoA lyase
MRTLVLGEQPLGYTDGDRYHHVPVCILLAAHANGPQAICGPCFQRSRRRRQVGAPSVLDSGGQQGFSPAQGDYDRVELILDAIRVQRRGVIRLGDEVIDEASRKIALVISATGRAPGSTRMKTFEPAA